MQPDLKNTCDLEYLASVGFSKVNVNDSDIDALKKKVRTRSVSLNSNFAFGTISLLIGAFIGITVFFTIYNAPKIYPAPKNKVPEVAHQPNHEATVVTALDTINVVADNFTRPTAKVKVKTNTQITGIIDTASVLIPIESPSLSISTDKLNETQLKYIPNAPVIFLHDLKITNYTSLYFRQNKFVTLTVKGGLDASYANKTDRDKENILRSEPSYYLHQAISDAMLYFNKKEYSKCQATLNQVLEINPNDINVRFYSGMCAYYKKDYVSAIKNFEFCINNSNNSFLNEAQFYKALSLYESNSKGEATELFKQIYLEGGFYAGKAKLYLN